MLETAAKSFAASCAALRSLDAFSAWNAEIDVSRSIVLPSTSLAAMGGRLSSKDEDEVVVWTGMASNWSKLSSH